MDYWNGNTNIHFRCAIAVKGVPKDVRFGLAEVDAVTVTDQNARIAVRKDVELAKRLKKEE